MHFKYASIIVQVYVSFMYGMFIPILIPVALFGIFNMYFVERLCLAYYFKQPPAYDAALNEKALSVLSVAPLMGFFFGYWALGNAQIFQNVIPSRGHAQEFADPKHDFMDLGTPGAAPMIFVMIVLVLGGKVVLFCYSVIHKCCWKPEAEPDVDENIGTYWDSLSASAQKVWYASEVHTRAELGIKTIDDAALEKLRTSQKGEKEFLGLHSYLMLSNLLYQVAFQY